MKRIFTHIALLVFLLSLVVSVAAIKRFPKPDFESGYETPSTITPDPRSEALAIPDVFVLIAALAITSWFVLKKRSRRGVFWMSIFYRVRIWAARSG